MKKILIVIVLPLFISIVIFISYISVINSNKDLTIDINRFGIYNVHFYDIIKKEKIDYGNKITTLDGKININTDLLKPTEDENIQSNRQFLVIIESRNYIGIGTYSYYIDKSIYQIRNDIYQLYKKNYNYKMINIKLEKKKSPEKFEVIDEKKIEHFLIIYYNEKNSVYFGKGAYILNSIDNNGVIGKLFVPNDFQVISNDSELVYDSYIGQYFYCYEVDFGNAKQKIKLSLFAQFVGGLSRGDESLDEEYFELEKKLKLKFYPVNSDL